MRKLTLAAALWALAMGTAIAQTPIMDGSRDATYGAALSIQNTNTQFGNGTNGDEINGGGGSEIDAVYTKIVGGRLYVLVAGNLETNFNKLELFFDSKAGGVNSIVGASSPKGVDPFCCGGFPPPAGTNTDNTGALQRMDGLTFDTGFNADYYLTISHGNEGNIGGSGISAYAATAHWADLSQGAAGVGQALGMQLAPMGLPNVLRGTTADVDVNSFVDGADVLVVQRGLGTVEDVTRLKGDAAEAFGVVDGLDLQLVEDKFGFDASTSSLTDNFFYPGSNVDKSDKLIGPALPGLAQGQLIDKTYVTAHPGFAAPELPFALPVVSDGNPENHRDMSNTIDLQMGINNSNTIGVIGDPPPYELPTTDTNGDTRPAGNPADVTTGFEFSIPLSALGNPAPTSTIKLTAFINGVGHDYASNQFTGTTSASDAVNGILRGNLGGDGVGGFTGDFSGVNLQGFLGNQFISIPVPAAVPAVGSVPEPTTVFLLGAGLAGLGLGRRRR